ncbi:MAG: hypothetical protein LQ348_004464 [Seirophora lacunosa]|nr:MAG: hypothetical protein LQ348_004464 [Seirophora lacunosa]
MADGPPAGNRQTALSPKPKGRGKSLEPLLDYQKAIECRLPELHPVILCRQWQSIASKVNRHISQVCERSALQAEGSHEQAR